MRKHIPWLLLVFILVSVAFASYSLWAYHSSMNRRGEIFKREQQIIVNELLTTQYRNWQTIGSALPQGKLKNVRDASQTTTWERLSRNRTLILYANYKMCKPCVQHQIKLADSLFAPYGEFLNIVIQAPGGDTDYLLDSLQIDTSVWATDNPFEQQNLLMDTPCYLLVEDNKVLFACHSAKIPI